jgi:predicted lipid-binding transport protein (Tim44 family)
VPAATPARPGAPAATPAPAAAQPKSGMSRWLGPIAGIAAGLGLAALLSHFGLSETFASFLLIALLVVGAIVLVRMLLRRTSPAPQGSRFAGAGGPDTIASGRIDETVARTPVHRSAQALGDGRIEPTLGGPVSLPPGFDAASFLKHAKANFNRLQAAYDTGDVEEIREVTTPEMFAQIRQDLASRGVHHATEVVRLDAEIVEVRSEPRAHWIGIRFTGLIREDGSPLARPFDEVWNLTKPADDSAGWLLAGIEQLAAAEA